MVAGDRRRFLLAGTAVLLGGCGVEADEEDRRPGGSETGRRADLEVLGAALEVERYTAAHYAAVDARGLLRDERRHIREVEAEIRRLRGRVPAAGAVRVGRVGRRELIDAEHTHIAAYQDLLPKLSDRRARGVLARILVDQGAHLSALGERTGDAFLVAAPTERRP